MAQTAEQAERQDDAAEQQHDAADRSQFSTVLVGALVVLVLLNGLIAVFSADPGPVEPAGPTPREQAAATVDEWLAAWAEGDRAALLRLSTGAPDGPPAAELAATFDEFHASLQPSRLRLRRGPIDLLDTSAEVPFDASVVLPGLGVWRYEGRLELAEVLVAPEEEPTTDPAEDAGDDDGSDDEPEPAWRVVWRPTAIHPSLTAGRRLVRTRAWGDRAPVLGADGAPLAATGPLAPVVGRVVPATPERAEELGPAYVAGDPVGSGGFQQAFERRLAGRPSGEVQLVEGETVVEVLAHFEGEPGQPVTATIDPVVQDAAEQALSVGGPAALVAIQPSTGAVRAVVSRPASGFNRALVGRYPPGSTFKVVTTTALLRSGVTPDQVVPCPASTDIGGRSFSNAEGEALGDVPFRTAFFRSCNTAFVRLASELEPAELVEAAELLGFNAEPDLAIPVAMSTYPEPSGVLDQVSSAIGQGRILTTPMQMASVAASIAAGGYRQPRLDEDVPVRPVQSLGDGIAETVQELMRLVVAEGTATRAQLPGEPVRGKTGTAEFGTERPPRTHAWFIGYRGDLAVAVVVEDAGFGGQVAAPIAADFLARTTG